MRTVYLMCAALLASGFALGGCTVYDDDGTPDTTVIEDGKPDTTIVNPPAPNPDVNVNVTPPPTTSGGGG